MKPTTGSGLDPVERPEPVAGPKDVKIRVQRAGLCGTDLHLEQWDGCATSVVKPTLVIGHEFFGEVVEIRQDFTSVQIGQKASGEGMPSVAHATTVGPNGVMCASRRRMWESTVTVRLSTMWSSRPGTCGGNPTIWNPTWVRC